MRMSGGLRAMPRRSCCGVSPGRVATPTAGTSRPSPSASRPRPARGAPRSRSPSEGRTGAGAAASTAARYLAARWPARRFATLEPEEFYDFTATRPQVRLVEGLTRQIDWPSNEFTAAAVPGSSRDVVFLHGVEPQL